MYLLCAYSEKPKHQSSLSSFFMKSDPQPVKSETLPEKSVGPSESTVMNCAWTLRQMVTKAEVIATLQYTDQNTPFASADNLGPCYQQQFPDSQIAKNVAIGPRKMSYVVGYGLGPYFAKLNVNNLVAGNSFFTLHFDETVTAQKRKQMDLLVRFWSEIHNEVKVKYLTSIMFGHARAADVVTEIMQALENVFQVKFERFVNGLGGQKSAQLSISTWSSGIQCKNKKFFI